MKSTAELGTDPNKERKYTRFLVGAVGIAALELSGYFVATKGPDMLEDASVHIVDKMEEHGLVPYPTFDEGSNDEGQRMFEQLGGESEGESQYMVDLGGSGDHPKID